MRVILYNNKDMLNASAVVCLYASVS